MITGSRKANIQVLSNSQQIEVSSHLSRKVSRKTTSTDVVVEKVLRNKAKTLEKKLSIHQLSKSYRGSRNFLGRSTNYRGSSKIAIRKSLEARQIARCRGGVELAFKNSFSRREKHKHEYNQTRNSTKDPISNSNSQNHLLTTILSTQIPKTHTHTKQV